MAWQAAEKLWFGTDLARAWFTGAR